MNITRHFYRLDTGLLTGGTITAPDAHLADNTPAGCGLVSGVTDWQSQRVNLATGDLVDYQPPAPADDAMRTWAWQAEARRWVAVPTLGALKADRVAEVDAAIQRHEAQQARPLREIVAALATGGEMPAAARARLAAIAKDVADLQALREDIANAKNRPALDRIAKPNRPETSAAERLQR